MDSALSPDPRRRFLALATGTVGGIGLAVTTIMFVESMQPSERARAGGGPVEVDLAGIAPGNLLTIEWRGRPVWVLHRTSAMLEMLGRHDNALVDPTSQQDQQPPYARNPTRSIRPEFLVATAICTHLGCIPSFRPEPGAPDIGPAWPGGFYCPCHGSRFDLAGRVFQNVPAPRNLEIPPYAFIGADKLIVGQDPGGKGA